MEATIKGTTMQVLEVSLASGEEVISTHGELSWMTPAINMSQTASTGASHGLMGALKRVAGGGGLLLTRYSAAGGAGMVAFAAKLPGHILEINLSTSGYLVHRHGWLCATPGVTPTVGFQQNLGAALFGGDGFILERLEGSGTAWVELAGETVQYELGAGENLRVHPGHVGVFEENVGFQITRVPGILNRHFGGDGYFLASLTGPGKVWLQSMPLPILAASLTPYLGGGAPQGAAAGGIAGGLMGGILGGR